VHDRQVQLVYGGATLNDPCRPQRGLGIRNADSPALGQGAPREPLARAQAERGIAGLQSPAGDKRE
jgi:hypothetical protein